jgi:hypothetical protein
MISQFREWLAEKIRPKQTPVSTGICGNRRWVTFMRGPLEYTTVCRDTRDPDAYSREELVEMLSVVRQHEAAMGWKVPE